MGNDKKEKEEEPLWVGLAYNVNLMHEELLKSARYDGYSKGLEKSYRKTEKEIQEKIARTMLENHLGTILISRYTGLSFKKVNKLKKKIKLAS